MLRARSAIATRNDIASLLGVIGCLPLHRDYQPEESIMKPGKLALALIFLLGAGASGVAAAHGHFHHGHFHHGPRVGVVIGAPLAGPWYYPPSYYPYPPVVVAPAAPPVYIEQSQPEAPAQTQPNDWYYCNNPDGYYPYVKQCPGGWQRIPAQPPSQP
jgi:hypothetical protein